VNAIRQGLKPGEYATLSARLKSCLDTRPELFYKFLARKPHIPWRGWSGPEGHAFWPDFRGLKPPAPSARVSATLALGNDGGLDLGGALHQFLEDPIEFIEVGVAGDEGSRLESAAGDQVEGLAAYLRGVVKGGA